MKTFVALTKRDFTLKSSLSLRTASVRRQKSDMVLVAVLCATLGRLVRSDR